MYGSNGFALGVALATWEGAGEDFGKGEAKDGDGGGGGGLEGVF